MSAELANAPSQARRRPSGAPSAAGAYSRRGGDDLAVAVWALGGPLTLTLMSSVLQAAATLTLCQSAAFATLGGCTGLYGFGAALGIVSALLITLYLVAFALARDRLHEKSMLYLSGFLFLWWIAGVGATTFSATTYVIGGTAYFSTWAALIFSALVLHSEWEQFQTIAASVQALEVHSRATFYLLIASIVNFISSIAVCTTACSLGTTIYAIIVGPVSAIICLLFLRVDSERLGGADKVLAIFLAVWWSFGFAVQTIGGPFVFTGNGFLGSLP